MALTRQPDGSLRRIESWENANFQAQVAAAAMLGLPVPDATPGWFWTDHGDNLQFVGEMQEKTGYAAVNRGDRKAIWLQLREGALAGGSTEQRTRSTRAAQADSVRTRSQ